MRGETVTVKLDLIAPDPRNHNVQSPSEYTKLVASIRQFGFVEPLIIREKKSGKQRFETINGEHRWRVAGELELAEVPCVNLGKVDDDEAEQLAIILNELKGKPDQVRLADRLRRINANIPFERLATVMPYGETELKMYLSSVDFNFANLSGLDTRAPKESEEEEAKADEKWLKFKFTKARADRVLALLEKIEPGDPAAALERAVKEHAKAKGVRLGSAASSKSRRVRKTKPKKEASA